MNSKDYVLLNVLNNYAEMAKNGNKSVLPAMGRIVKKLESNGYKIIVTENSYRLAESEDK